MPLVHHDLCFGCGTANLFGLQLDLEPAADGSVAGRFFVKQDHQGADGAGHPGVLTAALAEAAALAAGPGPDGPAAERVEVELLAPAPVGSFVRVEARVEREEGGRLWVSARALSEDDGGTELASATAVLRRALG